MHHARCNCRSQSQQRYLTRCQCDHTAKRLPRCGLWLLIFVFMLETCDTGATTPAKDCSVRPVPSVEMGREVSGVYTFRLLSAISAIWEALIVTNALSSNTVVRCECGSVVCARCSSRAHQPVSCEIYHAYTEYIDTYGKRPMLTFFFDRIYLRSAGIAKPFHAFNFQFQEWISSGGGWIFRNSFVSTWSGISRVTHS